VLGKLARQHDPNVLVGFDHADDAGVYQLSPDQALVQTVDFFTPIVDDPYTFGQIAATNSLSDVYAMGGKPLTALALVCFPDKADLEILERILAGGLSKMIEAGCTVIGGHSIRDEETKIGYSVTGVIHPKKIYQNAGAKAGDKLILTKALGTGVISTAIKKEKAEQAWIDVAIESMTTLNKKAAEVITNHVGTAATAVQPSAARQTSPEAGSREPRAGLHAMTDITGFGLIGHAREMALASNVTLEIAVDRVRLLPGALEYARLGAIPGGLKNNREFASSAVVAARHLPLELEHLLYDPQTSGGLLFTLPEQDAAALARAFEPAYAIGRVLPPGERPIRLI
jgi:selenide,water dikinase